MSLSRHSEVARAAITLGDTFSCRGEDGHCGQRKGHGKRALTILVCLLVAGSHGKATLAGAVADDFDYVGLVLSGGKLTQDEATKLEEHVKTTPDDLPARIKLLGYYSLLRFQSEPARVSNQQHVMWIIQNRPEASVAGSPSVYLDPALDGEAYATAKKIWLDHVESRPDNLKIISHAAQFFLLPDRDTAEQLLKKAKALDRDNPEWPERMGFLYMLDMQSANSKKARADAARKALKEYEAAKALSSDTGNQRIAIDLAKTAFEAGELAKAKNYAAQLAKQAGRDNGDAMHHGNLILGRIALRSGDLKTAKMRLLAAGKTPGSPPLSSFGPNMTLAKELLVKGQRSVVIEYLKLCSKFWTSGKDRLDEWTTLIKQGKIPDFGGNANY